MLVPSLRSVDCRENFSKFDGPVALFLLLQTFSTIISTQFPGALNIFSQSQPECHFSLTHASADWCWKKWNSSTNVLGNKWMSTRMTYLLCPRLNRVHISYLKISDSILDCMESHLCKDADMKNTKRSVLQSFFLFKYIENTHKKTSNNRFRAQIETRDFEKVRSHDTAHEFSFCKHILLLQCQLSFTDRSCLQSLVTPHNTSVLIWDFSNLCAFQSKKRRKTGYFLKGHQTRHFCVFLQQNTLHTNCFPVL